MIIKPIKINKDLLLIFISICVIIFFIVKTYCATPVTLKSITYNNKTYSFYPECIRYHVKANGYDKKLKDEVDNNLYAYASPGPGRELQPTNAKMQGYGNYVFKEDTNLFNFIDYCYNLNPQMTMACALYTGPNDLSSCDYTKLCTYSGKKLNSNSMTFVNYFWTNMLAQLGETFKSYQDLYFFDKYTNKGASLVYTPNKLANNGIEFLTCMMSYIFSTNQNSASGLDVKKGDIVPFLYVKDSDKIKENGDKKYDISDSIKNNPKEVTKYAYVACINGWADSTFNDLWLEEYESIFGEYNEEELCDNINMSIEELEVLYYEIDELYQNEKGNKGNALLGATIDTIIQSDYSISQQLEATAHYLQAIEGIGDYKENMARNELMARYMMENSHIGDTIKDYNVGITFITENLQRGTSESKNTSTAVLSDFQVLEFDHTLNKDGHSDDDGIPDLTELTNNTKWVNITGPATKMYNDMVSKGKTTKTMDEAFKDFVKKSPGMVKYEDSKLYYKTYDYDSNPMLNDTDFDGINDNIDGNKTDGTFKTSSNPIGRVEWTNDFRYFFIDNEKYNDELSTMSLMMCNLADGNSISGSDASGNINTYLNKMGFTNVSRKNTFRISPIENIGGNLYIGKKTIQVGANKKSVKRYKDVYGIFLGGFDTENNYKKLVTNFNTDEIETYYETISIDINDFIDNYIGLNPNGEDFCYWICGYSIAGGIASHVSPYLVGKGETYAYTFGAPNTTKGGSTANVNIKNIINEDDVIPKVLSRDEGYSRVGALYNDSIFDNLQNEYKKLFGNVKNYEAYPKRANTVKKAIKDIKSKETTVILKDRALNLISRYLCNNDYIHDEMTMSAYPKMSTYLNPSVKKVKDGHSIKSYYVLAKSLNGFDLNNTDVGWSEIEEEPDSTHTDNNEELNRYVVNAIKLFGEWYIKHVASYQNTPKRSRATQEANNYWDLYQNDSSRILRTGLGSVAGYKYLEDDEDINSGFDYNEEKYIINDFDVTHYRENININKKPNMVGDYCAEFAIAVIQYISNGKRGNVESIAKNAKKNEYGLNLHNTYSYTMHGPDNIVERADGSIGYTDHRYNGTSLASGSMNFYNAMYNLGFKRYFAKDMTVNDLQPGDLLVSDNHVEFYYGYDYERDPDTGSRLETLSKVPITDGHALSTFGWGDVQNRFPFINYFFYKEGDNFKLNRSGDIDENEYKVVWRLE